MAIPSVLSQKQETFKLPAPSATILPVRAWRNTISYLTEKEQDACALVCRRLGILVLCDPSADLEELAKRKRPIGINLKPIPSKLRESNLGPTGRFLFNHPRPTDSTIQKIHRQIKEKMERYSDVAQTVKAVCDIESAHPGYIPLYHAGGLNGLISALLIRVLLSTPYIQEREMLPCSVPLVKYPSPDGLKTVGEALSEFPPDFLDCMPAIRKDMLCCNPFLFANFDLQGESTWNYYLLGKNATSFSFNSFSEELCEKYQIKYHQKYFKKLEGIHDRLWRLADTFGRQNLSKDRSFLMCDGVLLQILVPPSILEKIAYASIAYGEVQKNDKPLLERCLALREDPDSQPLMQIRLLVQWVFANNYGIKVFLHGFGGFFNEEGLRKNKPDHMEERQWALQKKCLLRKKWLLKRAREIFTKMILLSPKKQRKPADIQPSIAPKPAVFNYTTLQKKASTPLPPGFTLQPYYNEYKLLVKIVQTDPDGRETAYLLAPPKPISVTKEEFDKLVSNSSYSFHRLRCLYDNQSKPVEILKINEDGEDISYSCNKD